MEESENLTFEPTLQYHAIESAHGDLMMVNQAICLTVHKHFTINSTLRHLTWYVPWCFEGTFPPWKRNAAALEKLLLDAANDKLVGSDYPPELKLYLKDINVDHLLIQLKMLPDLIKTYNQKNTFLHQVTEYNVRTLCETLNDIKVCKSLFSEVFKLVQIFLTIPVTTATAKRTYSVLRRLKTFLRSTMCQPRLNHAFLLHIHKERTDNLTYFVLQTRKKLSCLNHCKIIISTIYK